MKRIVPILATMTGVLLFGAPPAMAEPAVHAIQDVTGDTLQCGDTTYTIVSGEISIVTHAETSASGNTNFTITITPRTVKLQDQAGNAYTLRGAIWFGTTSNAATGGSQATSTDKFQIVSQGAGTVDSINSIAHVSPNGKEFAFSFGTCEG